MKLGFILTAILLGAASNVSAGKLLIVGGALESSNESVYRAFIDAIPAGGEIAVIPAASSRPATYANQFRDDLIAYGVDAEKIRIFPLAMVDDMATLEDESLWARNAYSLEQVNTLKNVQGFWFVGGDQTRITQLLQRKNAASPLLSFIRNRLAEGAIVGGTSAGAAIMSQQMIAGGDSIGALLAKPSKAYAGTESQERGELHWQSGLGFLPDVLVDQHFDRKARLGRLAATLCYLDIAQAIGVDENTAALVDLELKSFSVLGAANVTWLDGTNKQCNLTGLSKEKKFTSLISGIELTVLSSGDRWHWKTKTAQISEQKSSTQGHEAFATQPMLGGGPALNNARLDESLGFDLLDNKLARKLQRISLANYNDTAYLISYEFKKNENSKGYWGYLDGTKDSYSIVGVAFSIAARPFPKELLE